MSHPRIGLRENWKQFTLLVVVNAFVGGMIGLERTILPELATIEFAIAAKTAILSFIVVFGVVKAITNYYTGALANRLGRKNLLVAGWLIALPYSFYPDLRSLLGMDHCRQCAPGDQSRAHLVEHGRHEN